MSITYVLGAGASRHVGYPLAVDMGRGLLDFMLNSPSITSRASAEYLTDVFGNSATDIEDLITKLQSRIQSLKCSESAQDKAERMRLGNRRGWLSQSLREWFWEIHTKPAPTYAEFSDKIVKPGDVVITFNYDDSLERELKRSGKWDISRGYGFALGSEQHHSDVLMLKLHGSMNWLVSIFGGATGGAFIVDPVSSLGNHPIIHQSDLKFLGYEEFSGHTYKSGGAFPCLILPGRTKEFFYDTSFGHEYTEFWDNLWSQATEAVRRCDKIILCGYSLLPVDQRAYELLLRRPRTEARIEVISGNHTERIANDFRDAGFRDVEAFKGGYFEDWCKLKTC